MAAVVAAGGGIWRGFSGQCAAGTAAPKKLCLYITVGGISLGTLAYILPWVLGSIGVGLVSGFFLGRSRGKSPEAEQAHHERQATLKALVDLLDSAQRMTSDVECHNNEICDAARHVVGLRVSGEMAQVKQALLGQVETLLASNVRLQKDLACSRYRMEEQAQEIDHVRREARTDALTGVANRKAFDEKLEMLLTDWKHDGQPFSLILIDLDHFKRINDSHGHQAGDLVLEKVGHWLRQWVRDGDFAGRYGGDEFAVLLPRAGLEVARKVAQRICAGTSQEVSRIPLRREQITVSFSIGVATARPLDTNETILQRADAALYQSKHRGRNQVFAEEPDVAAQAAIAAAQAPAPSATAEPPRPVEPAGGLRKASSLIVPLAPLAAETSPVEPV